MDKLLAKLSQALRTVAQKLELPALWRWWLAELAALVPSAPRTAVQRRRVRPLLAFGKEAVVLWAPHVENGALRLVETATIALTGDPIAVVQAGRAALAALASNGSAQALTQPKVIVALPPAQVLRKRIVLPAAVEENLRDTLAYDLDRHTPFRPDQVYFDACVVARDAVKKEIRVDWAAARKSVVDGVRKQAEDWGASVVGVTPGSIAGGFDSVTAVPSSWSKLNLLPHEDRPSRTSWRRWQFWAPAAAVAVMLLLVVALPLWQKREYTRELALVTEHALTQATAADALHQQLDQAIDNYNFVLSKKYGYPSSVQLIDDVTRLLPDDTWLTQLDLKSTPKGKDKDSRREMSMRGESGNAGKLIAALQDSKEFDQAAPRSPTTKIQPGPGEVFDLGSQVVPLPAPTLVALVNPTPHPGEATAAGGGAPTGAAVVRRPPVVPPGGAMVPRGSTPADGAAAGVSAVPTAPGTATVTPPTREQAAAATRAAGAANPGNPPTAAGGPSLPPSVSTPSTPSLPASTGSAAIPAITAPAQPAGSLPATPALPPARRIPSPPPVTAPEPAGGTNNDEGMQ